MLSKYGYQHCWQQFTPNIMNGTWFGNFDTIKIQAPDRIYYYDGKRIW